MNSRNNLAYDPLYSPEQPERQTRTQSNIRIKVSKKTQSNQKHANAVGLVKLVLLATFAFVVLFRGVMITDRSAIVNQKAEEYQNLVTTNEKLQFEIDRSLDLDNVEYIARNELGMRRAEKYQTVYINIEQTDYVEKYVKNKFNPLETLKLSAGNLLAYLD